MTTETPAQRRTRLIEQYCALVFSNAEPSCSMTAIVKYAVDLADAVIAATPQPEPTRYPSEIETTLLDAVMTIKTLLDNRNYKTATELAAQIVAKHKELLALD